MSIILPKNVRSIIAFINEAGFPAHIVGGCVRDLVMKKNPHDWDITTPALPSQVKELFAKSWDTGIKHGTVTVSFEGESFEITTWRTESVYIDHRHPDRVEFTNSLENDLSRRDFTMNAMAYHPIEGLIDPFRGMEDVRNGIIRSVGDPIRRFNEDALRMLRAIRFSAQLGFRIETQTYEAIRKLSKDMAYVSFERIQSELNKILESDNPGRLSLVWNTRLNSTIFSDIVDFPAICGKVCADMKAGSGNRVAILSALLYGAFQANTPGNARHSLKRLKYDNDTISGVVNTLLSTEILSSLTHRNWRRACKLYGIKAANSAWLIQNVKRGLTANEAYATRPDKEPITSLLSGSDLVNARLGIGKEIGVILSLIDLCLSEKPLLNDRAILLEMAGEIHRKITDYSLR